MVYEISSFPLWIFIYNSNINLYSFNLSFLKKLQKINIEIIKKYLNIFIIFLFFVLVIKNFLRIKDNFGADYYNAPWPKIFSYSKSNKKQEYEEIKKDNKILFYLSKNGLCMYGPAPCSHYMIEQLNSEKKFGYNIYWIK